MAKTVLVVEDYADTRTLMRFLLEGYGYQVIEAADGQEAVEKANEQHPDLILMDLAMPGMDGLTATKVIRQIYGMENMPIIAVSAYGNLYHDQAAEAGFNEFINKPFDPLILEPLLDRYLSYKH